MTRYRYYLRRIGFYFLQGVLLAVPVAATVYVVVRLFQAIDSIVPYDIPGLGILTLFVVLTMLGFLGSTIIAAPIVSYFERLINRAPLLKSIYSAVKDLTTAFVGKKKSFTEPVLVKMMMDSEAEKLGFVTKKDLSEIGVGEEKVAVYLPHSYAFSGNLYIVPKKNVTPIDAKAADVMKFIVSGGVTTVDND